MAAFFLLRTWLCFYFYGWPASIIRLFRVEVKEIPSLSTDKGTKFLQQLAIDSAMCARNRYSNFSTVSNYPTISLYREIAVAFPPRLPQFCWKVRGHSTLFPRAHFLRSLCCWRARPHLSSSFSFFSPPIKYLEKADWGGKKRNGPTAFAVGMCISLPCLLSLRLIYRACVAMKLEKDGR